MPQNGSANSSRPGSSRRETSTSAASPMSSPMISRAMSSVISSGESADGRSPSGSPAGPTTDLFGPVPAPALPSQPPARKSPARNAVARTLCHALDELASSYAAYAATRGLPMAGNYGRSFGGSSETAARIASWESRLRARMVRFGSPLFELRWKSCDTVVGPPICRLRASRRRTSVNGFGGWPTARATDADKGVRTPAGAEKERERRRNGADLPSVALAAPWATPAERDYRHANARSYQERGGTTKGEQLNNQVVHHGPISPSSNAATGKRGQLDPCFSGFLMGYPPEWCLCAPRKSIKRGQ